MPEKGKSSKKAPAIIRLPISDSSLVIVPDDVHEGFQERIETGIDWTTLEAGFRHHKHKHLRENIHRLPFTQALENKKKTSYLYSFMYEGSGLTLKDQWELALPIKIWDIEKCATDEEKICFRNANNITDNMISIVAKAAKANDREKLKRDMKKVKVLRVTNSKMTDSDKGLLEYSKVVTLNLSGNYLSSLKSEYVPKGVRSLELQANHIHMLNSFQGLSSDMVYLGLSRNLLDDASVGDLLYLPIQLVVLDLSDNDIYNLELVLNMLVRLPNLTSLSLAGNPCSVCFGYAQSTLQALPKLEWLDDRQVLLHDRPEEPFAPHPDDFRSTYFTFQVFRIISVPPPPKGAEKGTHLTFHVELELPLLDSARRQFLMFRQNDSLTEIFPPSEDSWWESVLSSEAGSIDDGAEASSVGERNIYAQLNPKNSRIIKHYTTFQSNKVSWDKIMNFQEPVLKIFCPDLAALRDTLRSTVTVRLIYTQYTPPAKVGKPVKAESRSVAVLKSVPAEMYRTVFAVRCSLRRADWSQPSQHFHWDEALGTNDAIHWGDGDLSILQYQFNSARQAKGKNELEMAKLTIPEVMTAHFGFGIETISQ